MQGEMFFFISFTQEEERKRAFTHTYKVHLHVKKKVPFPVSFLSSAEEVLFPISKRKKKSNIWKDFFTLPSRPKFFQKV